MKTKSRKTYTKKQITEAITYWKGILKKLNETSNIKPQYCEFWSTDKDEEIQKEIEKKNPYKVSFNYWFEAQNSYAGGLIAASSKDALKQCISEVFDEDGNKYKCSKPYIFSNSLGPKYIGVEDKIYSMQMNEDKLDVDAIVNAIINSSKDNCVGFRYQPEDEDECTLVFEVGDSETMYENYWYEDLAGYRYGYNKNSGLSEFY